MLRRDEAFRKPLDPCKCCGMDLAYLYQRHLHNVRCGTDGERAYPKFEPSPTRWTNPRYFGHMLEPHLEVKRA